LEEIGHIEKSDNLIGYLTCDLSVCSIVPMLRGSNFFGFQLVVFEIKYSVSIMLSFHVPLAKNKYLKRDYNKYDGVTCGQGNMKVIVGRNQSHLSQYWFSKGIGS
jgi:hypothetical protein